MEIEISCGLILSTKKECAAEKIINKTIALLRHQNDISMIQANVDHSLMIRIEVMSWESCVLNVITLCQSIGYGWLITGSIDKTLSLWSTKAKVSGISAIDVDCERNTLCYAL